MVWNRQHVELLDPAEIAWRPAGNLTLKLLSRDPADGAFTALVRLPPGWTEEPVAWGCTMEWIVLEGSVRHGDQQFGVGGYSYRPAGFPNGPAASEDGAILLLFTSGPMTRTEPVEIAPDAVPFLDTAALAWGQPLTDKVDQRLYSKTVRRDEVTGERLFLLKTHDGQRDDRIEWHDCVEEIYQITGTTIMAGPNEPFVLSAGRYVYRPPLIPHGGFQTIGDASGDAMMLVRVNARLVNHYVDRAEANRMLTAYGDGLDQRMTVKG